MPEQSTQRLPFESFRDFLFCSDFNRYIFRKLEAMASDGFDPSFDMEKKRVTWINGSNVFPMEGEANFYDILKDLLDWEKGQSIEIIERNIYAAQGVEDKKFFINGFIGEIEHLLRVYDEKEDIKSDEQLAFVKKDLTTIKDYLTGKYSTLISSHKKKGSILPTHKIRWYGQINTLGAIFYDLQNGKDGQGPFINEEETFLAQFIHNNFSDADGKDLVLSTLLTYLREDKEDELPTGHKRYKIPKNK